MSKLSVAPRQADISKFSEMARRGEISEAAVPYLAMVFAAMRKAQVAIGPGHAPLDAIFEAVPESYRSAWLKKRNFLC